MKDSKWQETLKKIDIEWQETLTKRDTEIQDLQKLGIKLYKEFSKKEAKLQSQIDKLMKYKNAIYSLKGTNLILKEIVDKYTYCLNYVLCPNSQSKYTFIFRKNYFKLDAKLNAIIHNKKPDQCFVSFLAIISQLGLRGLENLFSRRGLHRKINFSGHDPTWEKIVADRRLKHFNNK